MNIASTQFSLNHNSFEIYVSGCDGICGSQCHNFELRDFSLGSPYLGELSHIMDVIDDADILIDRIWILGGEPLLQNHLELLDMLKILKNRFPDKELWVWTRFEIEEINKDILKTIDYVKTGRYLPQLKTDSNQQYDINLATSNQKIFKIGVDYLIW